MSYILAKEDAEKEEISQKEYTLVKEWKNEYKELGSLIKKEAKYEVITNASFEKIKSEKERLEKEYLINR